MAKQAVQAEASDPKASTGSPQKKAKPKAATSKVAGDANGLSLGGRAKQGSKKAENTSRRGRKARTIPEVAEDAGTVKQTRRGKRKEQGARTRKKAHTSKDSGGGELDDIRRRVRQQLIRMKHEQNFLDCYATEGWRGQSREKLRPESELARALSQLRNSKRAVREALARLEALGEGGALAEAADEEGNVHESAILCSVCNGPDAVPDNDIILCDGACDRAFHQLCLQPPLRTQDIPEGDEGWLCPVCDCRADCINAVNQQCGLDLELEAPWQDVFPEAESSPGHGGGEQWPSDDSEDDDYDPQRARAAEGTGAASPAAAGPSGSEDGGEAVGGAEEERGDSEGSDSGSEGSEGSEGSSDSDESGSARGDEGAEAEPPPRRRLRSQTAAGGGLSPPRALPDEVVEAEAGCSPQALEEVDEALVLPPGKRRRTAVDYRKLNDELFGVPEEEEDDEWGPRRGRAQRGSQASGAGGEGLGAGTLRKRGPQRDSQEGSGEDVGGQGARSELALECKQRLMAVFQETQLPARDVKLEIAREFQLTFDRVDRWFRSRRHRALHREKRKANNIDGATVQATEPPAADQPMLAPDAEAVPAACAKEQAIEHPNVANGLEQDKQCLADGVSQTPMASTPPPPVGASEGPGPSGEGAHVSPNMKEVQQRLGHMKTELSELQESLQEGDLGEVWAEDMKGSPPALERMPVATLIEVHVPSLKS